MSQGSSKRSSTFTRFTSLEAAKGCDEVANESAEAALPSSVTFTCDDEPLVYCAECWEREFGSARS
jgi:hypothetical protein